MAGLITIQQGKGAGILIKDDGDNSKLQGLIDDASEMIAGACAWPPSDGSSKPSMLSGARTLYLGADAVSYDGVEMRLGLRAVSVTTSVHVDPDWEYSDDDLVPATDYITDSASGVLLLKPGASSRWSRARRAQKVVCTAGYTEDDIPGQLQRACVRLVKHLLRGPQRQGKTGANSKNGSVSFTPDHSKIPKAILFMLVDFMLPDAMGIS